MAADQIGQMHFYLDWKFWSAVAAWFALILSQLPPIRTLLKSAKLDVEAYSRVFLTHKVGNPNAQLHLIISNTGGRELRIKKISLGFQHEGKSEFTLPAQNYLQAPADKDTVLLTSFKLKPNEEWAHLVNFLNYFSRKDEKNFKQLSATLREDIGKKRNLPQNKDVLVEADAENVQPLVKFFESRFNWLPGEYVLKLNIEAEPERASITRHYRITLFESDSKELEDYRNDYKFGDGIYYDSAKHTGVIVPLTEA